MSCRTGERTDAHKHEATRTACISCARNMLASRASRPSATQRTRAPQARTQVPRRGFAQAHHKLPQTVPDAISYGKHHGAQIIDCRFTDLHGTEHHIQFPMTQVSFATDRLSMAF